MVKRAEKFTYKFLSVLIEKREESITLILKITINHKETKNDW